MFMMVFITSLVLVTTSAWSGRASSFTLLRPMERRYMVQRVEQVCVVLVYSVLLTALLNGCPGGGDGSGDGGGDGAGSRFAGTWQGTTSQGTNVSFVVANDNTITTVTAGAHITGNACTAADLSLTTPDVTGLVTRAPIVGNRFFVVVPSVRPATLPPPVGIEHIVMTGTFANESTASGELQFTAVLAPSPCPGTATVTFQARKQ